MAGYQIKTNQIKILICMFLTLGTIFIYWQVQYHAFLFYDDQVYVTNNKYVRSGLNPESIYWAFTNTDFGFWHPLTWLSLMLDQTIYGFNAGGYHWTNVLFHIANTLLLFLVLYRMTSGLWRSSFVAALFAFHPLHVESVAWIAERKDVLSAFFWMLTMYTYVLYVECPGYKKYMIIIFAFVFGLMAKPMLVTLPFVLLLLDYWPLRRFQSDDLKYKNGSQRRPHPVFLLILEKVPFFIIAVVMSVITFFAEKNFVSLSSTESFSLTIRVANAIVSFVAYIWKMIWPYHLAPIYPHPGMWPIWQVILSALFLVFLSIVIVRNWRNYPYLSMGWFWYLGTMLPVVGLVQVQAQAMADRYTYIPLIGLFIIVAWGVPELLKNWHYGKKIIILSSGTALSFLIICSWFQVSYWQNDMTLFEYTLNITNKNYKAHHGMGCALLAGGNIDTAVFHFQEALKINPEYAEVRNDLGNAYIRQGKYSDAAYQYRELLRVNPESAKTNNNLGVALALQEKYKDAITRFRRALQLNPNYKEARNNLKTAEIQMKDKDQKKHQSDKNIDRLIEMGIK
jgi:hypothetical protein